MSLTGGSTWSEIDNTMDNGYSIAFGSIYQAGCWDHDGNTTTPSVPAVFKSTNDGVNWQRTFLSAAAGEILSLAVQPSNKNVAYAGGYVKNASNQDASALFKTTDGGTGWNEMAVPSPVSGADRINAVVIDPFDVNRILFGTNQHIYVSTNGGTDWQYSPKWAYVTYLIADGNTAGRIYAGTSGLGVLTTTDGGTNWNEMNAGLTNKYIQCMDLDPAGSTLYIGTNGGGVYRYSIETGVRGRDVPQPVEFILHQNYPNPFNPATTIRYELKKREEVLLSIVDMHGRAVRILLDGIQSAGANQAVWDGKDASGRDMPSGIYFCRLAAGGHQSVRKMILCK